MKLIDWILIAFMIFAIMILSIFYFTRDFEEKKNFCESEEGKYHGIYRKCYIKQNGIYKPYDILTIDKKKILSEK